jgi:hypothetical protein
MYGTRCHVTACAYAVGRLSTRNADHEDYRVHCGGTDYQAATGTRPIALRLGLFDESRRR